MVVNNCKKSEHNYPIVCFRISDLEGAGDVDTKSKIDLDIILSCLNIQDNNRYNIYVQFSIQYQYCGVKNLVLS